jgi:quinohemoprotein ethanol dehydrogenase
MRVTTNRPYYFTALTSLFLASACLAASAGKIAPDDFEPRNWPAIGRSTQDTHYSPLSEINRDTVSRLRLAWTLDLDVTSVNSTPLAVDGVVYLAAGYSVVHAVDGRTGKLLWRHDPGVARIGGHRLRSGSGIRGLAYSKGRLFVGTHDGRLLALDSKKGTVIWGVEHLRGSDRAFVSGAPRVFNDKVAIGFGDSGDDRGAVDVYSTEDGTFLWRWEGAGGGGAVWNAITFDAEFGRLYVGTGNERGNVPNRLACSLVAINAMTGREIWQYDESPADKKSCDSSQEMSLTTLDMDGQARRVILHAPRDGNFHVIDRETGKALSVKSLGEGAHLLFSQSFSPKSGLAYLPVSALPAAIDADTPAATAKSLLLAWNPSKQRAEWAIPTAGAFGGSVLSTAGDLVFQGQLDGYFAGFTSEGRKAWAFFSGAPALAAPISYAIGNKQYVAVLAGPPGGMPASLGAISGQFGWDSRVHPRRLLVFTLDGQGSLPPTPAPVVAKGVDVPEYTIDETLAKEGALVYAKCQWCHGAGAIAGGGAPDLRASSVPMNPAAFAASVRAGNEARGMPKFGELSDRELDSLRHYLRARARASPAAPKP